MNFTQLRIYFIVAGQVHIVKKGFYKAWTFDNSVPQYSDEMVYQTMHCFNKKSLHVRESQIARDTLIITYAESKVKRRVP